MNKGPIIVSYIIDLIGQDISNKGWLYKEMYS